MAHHAAGNPQAKSPWLGEPVNEALNRLKRLIGLGSEEVSVSKAALLKYFECVDEWNAHYFEDDWCDGPRGQSCADYIDWFNEVHR